MIVIYTGPSLSIAEAQNVLEAEYRPPIVRGDLARLPRGTKVVGIVDGVFFSESAIAHKEIVAVMQKGIRVFGSSSMGALRAAELTEFGMVGVGRIFECYRSGRITDDDEVAVTYSPVNGEQMSEPLVNVRYQLKAAEQAGFLATAERHALIDMIGEMFYPERSYDRIVDRAVKAGILSEKKGDDLIEYVRKTPVNLKAEDAVLLLETIKKYAATF